MFRCAPASPVGKQNQNANCCAWYAHLMVMSPSMQLAKSPVAEHICAPGSLVGNRPFKKTTRTGARNHDLGGGSRSTGRLYRDLTWRRSSTIRRANRSGKSETHIGAAGVSASLAARLTV